MRSEELFCAVQDEVHQLYRKLRRLNFKTRTEVFEVEFEVVDAVVADFIERLKYVLPVDVAGQRDLVLVGELVVVVEMQALDRTAHTADKLGRRRIALKSVGLIDMAGIDTADKTVGVGTV